MRQAAKEYEEVLISCTTETLDIETILSQEMSHYLPPTYGVQVPFHEHLSEHPVEDGEIESKLFVASDGSWIGGCTGALQRYQAVVAVICTLPFTTITL